VLPTRLVEQAQELHFHVWKHLAVRYAKTQPRNALRGGDPAYEQDDPDQQYHRLNASH